MTTPQRTGTAIHWSTTANDNGVRGTSTKGDGSS